MQPGEPDRVDLADADNVRYWMARLDVSELELKSLVAEAGTEGAALRYKLAGRERPAPHPEETYARPQPGDNKGTG